MPTSLIKRQKMEQVKRTVRPSVRVCWLRKKATENRLRQASEQKTGEQKTPGPTLPVRSKGSPPHPSTMLGLDLSPPTLVRYGPPTAEHPPVFAFNENGDLVTSEETPYYPVRDAEGFAVPLPPTAEQLERNAAWWARQGRLGHTMLVLPDQAVFDGLRSPRASAPRVPGAPRKRRRRQRYGDPALDQENVGTAKRRLF